MAKMPTIEIPVRFVVDTSELRRLIDSLNKGPREESCCKIMTEDEVQALIREVTGLPPAKEQQ